MLVAVKESGLHDAVLVDSVLATEMIALAMNSYLDQGVFNIKEVILDPNTVTKKKYNGLDDDGFFGIRHVQHTRRDPLDYYDPVITYECIDYILFDLDANKIIIPDFYDHDNDGHLYATHELSSYYSAYTHILQHITLHKPLMEAIEKRWFIANKEMSHELREGTLVSSKINFREYKPNSEIMNLKWCYCCSTFNCQCTEDELIEFSRDLPF